MRLFLFICTFLCVYSSQAQVSTREDVVYLKNGGIIRGIITEQIINESIKIETEGKNVYVFKMEDIEKITKEAIAVDSNKTIPAVRKGYIGCTLGSSVPLGDFADVSNGLAKTGAQLNLISYGYLFTDQLGIAATWFGAVNPLDNGSNVAWSYGGIMGGPLLSFPVAEKIDWDIKPMFGYAVTTLPDIGWGVEQATSFAFSLGTQFRIHVGTKVSLLLSADYFSTKVEFNDHNIEQNISTIVVGFGIAYRLK